MRERDAGVRGGEVLGREMRGERRGRWRERDRSERKGSIREYGSTLYVGMPRAKNGQKYSLEKSKSLFSQLLSLFKPHKKLHSITTHYTTPQFSQTYLRCCQSS